MPTYLMKSSEFDSKDHSVQVDLSAIPCDKKPRNFCQQIFFQNYDVSPRLFYWNCCECPARIDSSILNRPWISNRLSRAFSEKFRIVQDRWVFLSWRLRKPRNWSIYFDLCNSIHDSIRYSWNSYWVGLSVWKIQLHCNEAQCDPWWESR